MELRFRDEKIKPGDESKGAQDSELLPGTGAGAFLACFDGI
jgi:hypothetical protein